MSKKQQTSRGVIFGAPDGFTLGGCISTVKASDFRESKWFGFSKNNEILRVDVRFGDLESFFVHNDSNLAGRLKRMANLDWKTDQDPTQPSETPLMTKLEAFCFELACDAGKIPPHQALIDLGYRLGLADGKQEVRNLLKQALGDSE